MRGMHLLPLMFFLILLVGCAGSIKDKRLLKKYPPRSEMPITLKTLKERYTGRYVYFGSFNVMGQDETHALKKAAKYGADAVHYHSSKRYMGKGVIYKHRDVQKGDGSWWKETKVYQTGESIFRDAVSVTLFRHDPSQDVYTRWFRDCFKLNGGHLIIRCDTDMLKEILSKGVDPNIRDRDGFTALYRVVPGIRWQSKESSAAKGCIPYLKVKILLDAGADPNIVPQRVPNSASTDWKYRNIVPKKAWNSKKKVWIYQKYPTLIQYIRGIPSNNHSSDLDYECVNKLEKLLLSKGAKL
ncbi:MAG TPA: hypothetical protein DCO77_02105 [Nitrospiraceae bacterium]|nr:hypothetical protein [Nitrospiraceae bacterium]